MDRDTSQFSPNPGGTILSYVEVTDWETKADRCIFHARGGVTSDFGWGGGPSITSKMQYWTGSWHDYDTDYFPDAQGSDRFYGYKDMELCEVDDYFARQAADRIVSVGCYSSGAPNGISSSARAYVDYTVPHLAPSVTWAASNPVVRNSDNSITLTWNAPSLEYSAMCLEVSTDGGSWSQFAVLWNTATSYEWTGCSADHSYQFRIRTNYLASYSAYDTGATVIYMTPAAPQSISTAAAGGTNITVNLVNPSPVATKVQYQVSTDDGATWGATQDSASLTSFSVSASGTVKIRVRNYNATGTSAWLTSGTVTTICPPNPPTLTAPTGNVLDLAAGSVTFEWVHNTLDGSAQSAAQIDYSTNGGSTWTSITGITTAQSYTMAIPWSAGATVTWRARTKGADANYSNWSSTKAFNVYTAPTLSITSPSATVTGMPISLTATYSDMAGFTCQAATVSLQKDGRTLYSEPATINGNTITAQLDTSEFLPTNGETYTVVLTARSSSSLQTTANATFTTAFTEPQAGELSISNDPETGYASLLATFDNGSSDVQYSGATNEQYDSEPAFVKLLTVEGQTEEQNSVLVSIENVSVGDGIITTTLRSAGSVHDQLQADKDSWTVKRNVTTHTFSGTENWQTATTDGGLKAWWLSTSQGYGPTVFKNRERYAGGYTTNTGAWKAFSDKTIGSSDGSNLTSTAGLLIVDNDYANVTAWKNHLVSNPLEIIWAAPSPTTDTETSMSTIEIGSAFTVGTELDSTFDMTAWDGSADATSISVARVNTDGITPLIEDAASGAGAVDKYAPLNTPYQYAVTTKSNVGAIKTVLVDNIIETDLWFAYWTHKDGENVTEMTASAKWNPDNGGIQIARPQKTRVYYAGRKDPVSYDGSAVSLNETPSWMIVERSEIQPFVQLIEDGGRGVYKSCDGWVYHADFDLTLTPKYTAIGYYGGVGLSVTRIAGDAL